MKPFLYQVASLFYATYGTDVSRRTFVFPNRRAGLFFRKYLAEVAGQPIFAPAILTISDLFLSLSDKQPAERINMLFTLYRIYTRKSASEDTFDEFLYWGEMLLNDFDDIDKYMADARMLFSNVTDLRAIEADFGFLNEKQIAAIRTFWSAFYPANDSPSRQNFLAVWQVLYELYCELKQTLAADEKGYEGMIAREVVEQLQNDQDRQLPFTQIVFVGLNVLTTVEEQLLLILQKRNIADFYWDYASDKLTDPDNKASFFATRNQTLFPSQLQLPEEPTATQQPQRIDVIGVPSGVGQAKQVHNLLSQIPDMTEEETLRTAVVLPDEHLLIPVLNAIPENIRQINVTMGYPLAGTPIASLVEYIRTLQKNVSYADQQPTFYFRDVLPVLNHRYILATAPDIIPDMADDVARNNKIRIPADFLHRTPFLKTLFTPIERTDDASDYLIAILSRIADNDDDETSSFRLSTPDVEREFIFHLFTTVNRLKDAISEAKVEMTLDVYFRLLKRLTALISIPFRGEPLAGLQIMGVLETRALDFDRIIILSMNEGIFPRRTASASFIPYNLRRAFSLPTYEHQDSVWAYHFYRLIHRASHLSLLYDSRTNGLQTGEMSRFIHQLHYHYEVPVQRRLVVYNISSAQPSPISIEKTEPVLRRMDAYRTGGDKAISASAINTWLDCPLKFYFSYVEGIREEDEVSETIESNVFGSILHKVMEDLYKPLEGKTVTADLLHSIRQDAPAITHAIEAAFASIFFKTAAVRPLSGQNFLTGEMIRKYVEKILARDAKMLTPFVYIASEKRMNDVFTLSDGSGIQLKGFIDRIDQVHDATRIIDYKTGTGLSAFQSIESLFETTDKERPKAVMQAFMYAWLFSRIPGNADKCIRPGIYYVRTLFADNFDPAIYERIDKGKKTAVDDFRPYAAPFEDALRTCLNEIFDTQTPFSQPQTKKSCTYCPFSNICG